LPTLPIVEQVNVFHDLIGGFGARPVAAMMHEFGFQRAPETLHRRVVIAVSFAAHRHAHSVASEQRLILMAAILAPAIRMVNQTHSKTACGDRLLQCTNNQIGRHPRTEAASDDLTREQVFDRRHV